VKAKELKDATQDGAQLQVLEQFVIFRMGPNPEPDNCVTLHQSKRPPTDRHAYGITLRFPSNQFEVDAGMRWPLFPQPVALAGLLLDAIRQSRETLEELISQF
jgi:hypothetical protein